MRTVNGRVEKKKKKKKRKEKGLCSVITSTGFLIAWQNIELNMPILLNDFLHSTIQ